MSREGRSNDLPQKEHGSIVPDRFFGVVTPEVVVSDVLDASSLNTNGDDGDLVAAAAAANLVADKMELAISFALSAVATAGEIDKRVDDDNDDDFANCCIELLLLLGGEKDAGLERSSGASCVDSTGGELNIRRLH